MSKNKITGIEMKHTVLTAPEKTPFWVPKDSVFLVESSEETGLLVVSKHLPVFLNLVSRDVSKVMCFKKEAGKLIYLDDIYSDQVTKFLISRSFMDSINKDDFLIASIDLSVRSFPENHCSQNTQIKPLPKLYGYELELTVAEMENGDVGYIPFTSLYLSEARSELVLPCYAIAYSAKEYLPLDELQEPITYVRILCSVVNGTRAYQFDFSDDKRIFNVGIPLIPKQRTAILGNMRVIAKFVDIKSFQIQDEQEIVFLPETDPKEKLAQLHAELDYAVFNEDYELAAKIRDDIDKIKK